MRKVLFVRRPIVQVALIILLLAVVAVVFTRAQDRAWATSATVTYNTLRASSAATETTRHTLKVYGGSGWPGAAGNMGAGSGVVTDENNGLIEVQPYTDTLAIFNPQLPQAPRKDSITWNPLFMSETETLDENQAQALYDIRAGGINASEKVWFRMWYEPQHWDKDCNANGEFDRDPITGEPTDDDVWYPAIMQEFTYLLMLPDPVANEPKPTYGQVGPNTHFVFPVGMREEDLFADGEVDTTSDNAQYGYGLTSLDGNFDDVPDTVYVESELSLQQNWPGIAIDFDGDGIEHLDPDGTELNGDELAVFCLDPLKVQKDRCIQFLDHMVCLQAVFEAKVNLEVWYTGSRLPEKRTPGSVSKNGVLLLDGAWFVYLQNVDTKDETAWLMVGRALGATHSSMEGDSWFLKRFYVDGHEYNVVAIKTRGLNEFQFITIRTPIPKLPVTIEQHSVDLQNYLPEDPLSVMPPYNYEHYILKDVQAITAFDTDEDEVDYLGELVGPVSPILQENGPFPYKGVYPSVPPVGPYDDPREVYLRYVDEDANPQFLGELKEKYGEITATTTITEFWYVEQWWTRPWEYTEFVLPDIQDETDLYLLTSAFTAPQAEYRQWVQDAGSQDWTGDRVKFWFDPAEGGKKYKGATGLRIYGRGNEGAGDTTATDPGALTYQVEVPPYTDPWAPFNPQLPQAPGKDSLTFNPAYMDRFRHGGESLASFYRQIKIEGADAREKVFLRMWYEPEYVDKIRNTEVYTFPALMQEFTYMYLDYNDQPSHSQPGELLPPRAKSRFAFPIGTASSELPAPDTDTGELSFTSYTDPSRFGYGLTTFDADFDGSPDPVTIHSERTLSETTGIQADFDGDGDIDLLDGDGDELSGDELVIFAVENIVLGRYESAMFLDHMVTLDNIASGPPTTADLKFWGTGGGLNAVVGGYSLHPYEMGTRTLSEGEMVVLDKYSGGVHKILGGNNLGRTDGAWFAYLTGVNPDTEQAELTIGRALGATYSAIDNGASHHDMEPGDPWYLKRFFVDGHEYNVVAIKTVPPDIPGEEFEFQYITIRTPVPKVNFVNRQDSQKLEGYNYDLGTVFGVDTSIISVMPPFNFHHTRLEDIQKLKVVPEGETEEQIIFANPEFYNDSCMGDWEGNGNVEPLQIQIVAEDTEAQFFGELKEKFWDDPQPDRWSTEQFHILPDRFTELALPAGQLYLLTSDWESDQSWVHYYGCDPTDDYFTQDELSGLHSDIPAPNAVITFTGPITNTYYSASLPPYEPLRVKFWYDPDDSDDLYVGTWGMTPTCTANASSNSPVCEGGTIELYGGPAGMASYSWTGPGGFSSTDRNPTRPNATLAMAGTYTLTVTIGSCTDTATTDVTVNAKPTATASSNSPVAEGETLQLYGGPPGMDSSWTGPNAFFSSEISPTVSYSATTAMAGTYQLTVTNTNGCRDTASTHVTVGATDENQGYLVPQHSGVITYCNTTEVEVWVNETGFKSGQIKLTYDDSCADVTDWDPNLDDFAEATWDSTTSGEEWITFRASDAMTGTYRVVTLAIHCESHDQCTTDLDFVEDGPRPTKLFDAWGSVIPGTWQDGTFTCGVGMCGNVAPYPGCDEYIDMGDVSLLHSYVGDTTGYYSLCCEWCGNVAPYPGCDEYIDMGDVSLLHSYVGDTTGYYHLCCESGGGGLPTAPSAVSAAGNEVNLVPQESSAPFCETADVEIWVDATGFKTGQIKLTYDEECANVEGWEPNLDDFLEVTWDSDTPGQEWITFLAQAPMTGTYRIGTLTIHGVYEEGCITILDFVEDEPMPSKLFDDWGREIPATWTDGTFRSVKMYEVYLPLVMKNSQ